MEQQLTKLKALKKITLTDEERNLLRVHAARIVLSAPLPLTRSFFNRGMQYGMRIVLSSMLFVFFLTGSVSAFANHALPGDALYSFKVNVNEQVKGFFLDTPAAKAVNEQYLVETRVNEIQALANTNALTPAKQATAEAAINSNVADLSANLTTLSAQSPDTALSVTAALEQTLKANKATLENTPTISSSDTSGKTAALNTVNATLQKVSNQEVQIISNEIDAISTNVNAVPTGSTQTPATPALKVTPVAP